MERSWSDVPEELLHDIARRLNTDIDEGLNTGFFKGNRFRCVCSSWRRSSSVKKFHLTSPLSSIKSPFKISEFTDSGSTVYRLEPSPNHSAGWFVQVKNKSPNKMRLLIPPQVQNLPKVIDLTEYRIFEICRDYTLVKTIFETVRAKLTFLVTRKIVFKPSNPNLDNYTALMTNGGDKRLAIFNSEDEKCTEIVTGDEDNWYNDVIIYKGKFYVVDFFGKTVVVDPFSKLVTHHIASPKHDGCRTEKYLVECGGDLLLFGCRTQKYLVECGGDLLLVYRCNGLCFKEFESFQVYKLNEDGHNWVAVENLGDQMLFLNISCSFSASAKHFEGCKGNSIYFPGRSYDSNVGQRFAINNKYYGAFDLKSDQISQLNHRLPTWIKS